jgi:hypothetical protein
MLLNSLFHGAISLLFPVLARKTRHRRPAAPSPGLFVDETPAEGMDLAGVLAAVERALLLPADGDDPTAA